MTDQTDLAALLMEGLRIFGDGDGHETEYRDNQWRCLDDCPAHVWLARVRGALAAGVRVTGDAGLDVERLARAMSKVAYPDPEDAWPNTVKDVKDLYRYQAAAVAREYAALATEEK